MDPFVTQQALESLEWPQVVARLREHCRTSMAHARLGETASETGNTSHATGTDEDRNTGSETPPVAGANLAVFEATLEGARARLEETSEARGLLDAGEIPPLHGVHDLSRSFGHVRRGGTLEAQELQAIHSTLSALHATAQFLTGRVESAPQLSDVASCIADLRGLEREIDRCIDPSGEVSDDASPALAAARRSAHQLGGELARKLERDLRNPDITRYLSDNYFTVRNDRYVLPVKADFRGRIRGIVHDASNSGTTVFIEPESVVELNNRLKQAQLEATREEQRVLRALSEAVAEAVPHLEAGLGSLEHLDLAFARGHLSRDMEAVAPEVGREGVFDCPQLRHPLLARRETVPNDLRVGADFTCLVISGPNAGGKTVAMKALGLAALFVRAGLHVPAEPGARVDWIDALLTDIGDGQDIGENLSTFSAHMANLARIVESASERSLVLLDEIGVGTDPGEGAALAQSVLETLAEQSCRVIATTHYNLLKEMADVDARFRNASVEFDAETLAPTYRLHLGAPGASSATAVASRMGMPSRVLDRANALLDREDRRLDRMLSELAASRAALDEEQRTISQLRIESEATKEKYRRKLERLGERRDQLFHAMRSDLDVAFKNAHAQVAAVIRDLQREGDTSSRDTAHARDRLLALEAQVRNVESHSGAPARQPPGGSTPHIAVDWRSIRAGDRVRVPGGGIGVLASLPDRRGRVRVRVGAGQLVVLADQVGGLSGEERRAEHQAQHIHHTEPADDVAGGRSHCDLRGLRVDEALDRLAEAIDLAMAQGSAELQIVHGLGTGALRKAVRESLAHSPFIGAVRSGERDEGGDGATFASLAGG